MIQIAYLRQKIITSVSSLSSFPSNDLANRSFFSLIFLVFVLFLLSTSAAPQRPAQGTVSSQVTTHLRTDRVCCVLGRTWIRTQDY
jgi:hypothetical protein